jgi:predicted nucleic acid-binding protein
MGRSYLIDTNAVIDLIAGKLPTSGEDWIENVLVTEDVYLSIINRIELLGFNVVNPYRE